MNPDHALALLGASMGLNALLLASWRVAVARASRTEALAVGVGQAVGVAVAALLGPKLAERLHAATSAVPEAEASVEARLAVIPQNHKEKK